MPKAYWIVRVSVRDAQRYSEYLTAARPAFEKFGAILSCRGRRARSGRSGVMAAGRARLLVVGFARWLRP